MLGFCLAFSKRTDSGGRWNVEKFSELSSLESKKPALIPLSSKDWAKDIVLMPKAAGKSSNKRFTLFISV
jgi:hypothetical protein